MTASAMTRRFGRHWRRRLRTAQRRSVQFRRPAAGHSRHAGPRSRATATKSSRRSASGSGAAHSPSPGVVYPTLSMIEDMGYATAAQEQGERQLYTLTAEGEAVPRRKQGAGRRDLRPSRRRRRARGRGDFAPVLRAMENLRMAVRLRVRRRELDRRRGPGDRRRARRRRQSGRTPLSGAARQRAAAVSLPTLSRHSRQALFCIRRRPRPSGATASAKRRSEGRCSSTSSFPPTEPTFRARRSSTACSLPRLFGAPHRDHHERALSRRFDGRGAGRRDA